MSTQAINFSQLAKYLKPEASQDLNKFLETLPANVGKVALIVAAIVWASAAGLALYTMIQTKELAELKTELAEKTAVKPVVPHIIKKPVGKVALEKFVKSISNAYDGLDFRVSNNKITIISKSLELYPQFREAMGHVANARGGWVASIDTLCMGNECRSAKLAVTISLNTIVVE